MRLNRKKFPFTNELFLFLMVVLYAYRSNKANFPNVYNNFNLCGS